MISSGSFQHFRNTTGQLALLPFCASRTVARAASEDFELGICGGSGHALAEEVVRSPQIPSRPHVGGWTPVVVTGSVRFGHGSCEGETSTSPDLVVCRSTGPLQSLHGRLDEDEGVSGKWASFNSCERT